MVIMQVIPALYEGGAERFVIDLCNSLSEQNHEVHLVLFFDVEEKMFMAKDISPKVHIHSLRKKLGFDYHILYRLRRLARRINPDVVHTHLGSFEYNVLNFLFSRKGVKYVHTIHNDALKECPSKYKREFRKIFFAKNKVIPVTISHESSISYREVYGLNNDCIIYNGRSNPIRSLAYDAVSREFETQYRITAETKVILNVGSIHYQKNQIELAKAVNALVERGEDIVLLIIGGERPDSREWYQNLAAECNERVKMLGVKGNVADYLLLADAFCLSSVYEGMPISLLEAFATKCLALCSPVGGIVDMIEDGVNGMLAEGANEENLQALLKRFTQQTKEVKESMVEQAYDRYLDRYAIEACSKRYSSLYVSK